MTERQRNLFLAITIPDDLLPGEQDPDAIADEIVRMLNQSRTTHEWARQVMEGTYDTEQPKSTIAPIYVNGIPSPQWLTPTTLKNLVAAAHGKKT